MQVQVLGTGVTRVRRLLLARARLQACVATVKVWSREMKEVNRCFSWSVNTATALGMIIAVLSFVMFVTLVIGSWSCGTSRVTPPRHAARCSPLSRSRTRLSGRRGSCR